MNSFGQTICLSMIVKNEAPVIRRCLDSVRPIIDHWIIVDTGSTDGTQAIIRAVLSDLPGRLVERPWVNFAHNRNEALRLARPRADYSLIIDADDVLLIPPDFVMPKLAAPGYEFQIIDLATVYNRVQLVSNKMDWHYRGVLHEFLDCKSKHWREDLPLSMRRGADGARHDDEQATYARDAAILEKALAVEKDPFLIARYTFYLAQSYRDFEEDRKARDHYLKRASLGHWIEEIYISLFSAGLLMEKLNDPAEQVLETFERAIALIPERLEVRYAASRFCRVIGRHVEAYHYAEAGLSVPMPAQALFLQPWIYRYGLRDEYAVAAFNTGQYRACLSACLENLGREDLPPDVRSRIAALARDAQAKLVDPIWGFKRTSYSAEIASHGLL